MIDNNNCYLWQGDITRFGYAMTYWDGKYRSVHRVMYFLVNNVWSDRENPLDHLCRVRHCVNPEHLEMVTPKVNSQRGLAGKVNHNIFKTHCPQGHEYTPENTRRYGNQGRKCLACLKARRKVWAQRNKDKIRKYQAEWARKNYIKKERPKTYKKRSANI